MEGLNKHIETPEQQEKRKHMEAIAKVGGAIRLLETQD